MKAFFVCLLLISIPIGSTIAEELQDTLVSGLQAYAKLKKATGGGSPLSMIQDAFAKGNQMNLEAEQRLKQYKAMIDKSAPNTLSGIANIVPNNSQKKVPIVVRPQQQADKKKVAFEYVSQWPQEENVFSYETSMPQYKNQFQY